MAGKMPTFTTIQALSKENKKKLFNLHYFKPGDRQGVDGVYWCTAGCTGNKEKVLCTNTNSRTSNMTTHIQNNHGGNSVGQGGWQDVLRQILDREADGSPLGAMGFTHCHPKGDKYYRILKTIIDLDLPFSYVENPIFREFGDPAVGTISTDTLMGLLEAVAGGVEEKIREMLPDLFMILFDGWDDGRGRHILGIPKTPCTIAGSLRTIFWRPFLRRVKILQFSLHSGII